MGREGVPKDVAHEPEGPLGTLTLREEGFSSNHETRASRPLNPSCSAQHLAQDEGSVNPRRMNGFVEDVTQKQES